ncbi:MAG: hypothetical protein EOP86_05385 [Verrucomicrobiaceae bacterium]|nr:MAG: hypothetical protein EOP86_05385 [Verrucomicrobiaceae bacterium]
MRYLSIRRRLGLWAGLLLLAGAVWLGVYVYNSGFTKKWRGLIAKELAKHGLRAEIGRLTLDPVEGLTARDVKIFDMTHRDQHLADIDSLSLDIDLTRLINKEPFLRTIHLQQADVAMPVDPGDPKSEWLTVRDLTARLVFRDDRVEIARADGTVSGIHMHVTGNVLKDRPKAETAAEKSRRQEERSRQIREMRDRRGALRSVLRILDRFQTVPGPDGTEPAHKAELDLDVQGRLTDMDQLEVRASLNAGPLKFAGGRIESLHAEAGLAGGIVTLKTLELRDGQGVLHAGASWKIKSSPPVVDLALESGIDWQPVLRTVLDEAPWLGEVVCYAPPEFEWEGKWYPGGRKPGQWPVEGQGHLKARRFSTRGVVFEGMEGWFSVGADNTFYIRDGLLTHHTGTVRGHLLMQPGGGRYEVEWLMSVNSAAPFISDPGIRGVLERFSFRNQSRVAVRMTGRKETGGEWRHGGRVELQDFAYRKTPLQEVSADLSVDPSASPPVRFSKVRVSMDGETGTAEELGFDFPQRLLWIRGGSSTLMPARFVSLFNPALAQELTKYRFARSPSASIGGVIDLKGLERSDYTIQLRTRSRAGLDIADSPYEFDGVSGTVHIAGPKLSLKLTGDTVPGTMAFKAVRLDDTAPAAFEGEFSLLKERRPPPSWNVKITAPGRVSVLVLRRTWPLDQFVGRLNAADNRLEVVGGATLFGGKFGASMQFPEIGKPTHHASIVLERVSFARLAKIVDPARATEGWISGNFSYDMDTARPETMRGTGNASLENGNIFALPLLGPLSSLLKAMIPDSEIGYSVARNATTTVNVAAGKVMLPDFEAATGAFKLKISGTVDYMRDKVDFLARVDLRGATGILLSPVSKLLEYTASGTMSNPDWHARFLSNPFKRQNSADDGDGDEDTPRPPLAPKIRRPATR